MNCWILLDVAQRFIIWSAKRCQKFERCQKEAEIHFEDARTLPCRGTLCLGKFWDRCWKNFEQTQKQADLLRGVGIWEIFFRDEFCSEGPAFSPTRDSHVSGEKRASVGDFQTRCLIADDFFSEGPAFSPTRDSHVSGEKRAPVGDFQTRCLIADDFFSEGPAFSPTRDSHVSGEKRAPVGDFQTRCLIADDFFSEGPAFSPTRDSHVSGEKGAPVGIFRRGARLRMSSFLRARLLRQHVTQPCLGEKGGPSKTIREMIPIPLSERRRGRKEPLLGILCFIRPPCLPMMTRKMVETSNVK
jgi:hypothetical protein